MSGPTDRQPVTLIVGEDADGSRLDVAVGAHEEIGSRAEAQRLIDAGRVRLNGAVVAKRHTVRAGDTVTIEPMPRAMPGLSPEAMELDVRFEDEHLLVVDKPAGVVTHPSRGHDSGTLVHGLLARGIAGGQEPFRPGIVHRLDRDTSGLLIVAKTDVAHRLLQDQLRERLIDRRYLALVHGAFPPALAVDQAIGRDRRNRMRMSTTTDTPREARTRFRTVERFERFALVEARLDTGRTHQIRVHLEFAAHPVVGDPLYSRRRSNPWGLERQFLHAAKLQFPHPLSGDELQLESALPMDLQTVLDSLRAAEA